MVLTRPVSYVSHNLINPCGDDIQTHVHYIAYATHILVENRYQVEFEVSVYKKI